MIHPNFKRCEKCLEELHTVNGEEIGHELPCDIEEEFKDLESWEVEEENEAEEESDNFEDIDKLLEE